MVDGVNGKLDHVVKHVAVGTKTTLEHVTVPHPHVEAKIVMVPVLILITRYVIAIAVQVR